MNEANNGVYGFLSFGRMSITAYSIRYHIWKTPFSVKSAKKENIEQRSYYFISSYARIARLKRDWTSSKE